MRADEGYIRVPGGKVWYRVVAPDADTGETPLLCLHGGPGFTHCDELLAEEPGETRRVIRERPAEFNQVITSFLNRTDGALRPGAIPTCQSGRSPGMNGEC